MPVLRQAVDTGGSQLQLGDTNYVVGTAAPQMQEVQPEYDGRGEAIKGFLGNFMDTFTPAMQEQQQRATAQGEIDAAADPDALKNSDSAADKQNIFMRDAYQKGYLGAAVQQSVTDFQAGITNRAQQAGMQGMSDEDFLAQERQKNAQLMQSLGSYLPHMSAETVGAVAQSLDQTRQSAMSLLRKTRLGQANINNQRTVEQGSFQAQQNFLTQLQTDGFDQSWHFLQDQANLIGTNPMYTEDQKRSQLHNLFLTTAQNINDPDVINQLNQKASGILGVTDPALNGAMHSEWERAGTQQAGATIMNLQNNYDAIGQMPVYQQNAAKQNFQLQLIDANRTGRISTGQMMDFYNKLHKEQTPKLQMKGLVTAAATAGGALSVEALHSAAPGVTRSEIQSQIQEAYPNTPAGNASMLAAGVSGHDPWVVNTALTRAGTQMTDQLNTLQFNKMEDDGNGNKTLSIPQSVQDNITGFMAMYKSADPITQQTLMNTLPEDWRGVLQTSIAQDPSNANNNVLDTIKRVVSEKQSGAYKEVPVTPTAKMLDTSSATHFWNDNFIYTTDNAAEQRAQLSSEIYQEYSRVRSENIGLLQGKSDSTINTMLVGMIKSRTVPLSVGGKDTGVVLPSGTSADSYARSAGVDAGTFTSALQATADSVFRAQGYNPDNVDRVRLEPQAGGPSSNDFVMVVDTKNQAGIYESHRISLPMNAITRKAQTDYADEQQSQRRDGANKAGTNIATFFNEGHGGYQTMAVSGTNSVGMDPSTFNGLLANTMRYEGFKPTKSGGSVGYGWHDASGDSVPDNISPMAAQQKLKELYENRYIPMTRKYLQQSGVRGDSIVPMLADMTYQRPADAQAMAEVMGKFQRHEVDYPEVINTLHKLPSWSDAGGGDKSVRNKDRMQQLYIWASIDGNRQTDRTQNPFGTLGQ